MKAHIYLVICSRYPAQIFAFRLPQHWLNKTRLYRPRIRKQADLFNILCKPEMQFRVFGMENRAGQFPHAPDHGCFLEPLWHFCDLYSSISCVNALQKKQLQPHIVPPPDFQPICPVALMPLNEQRALKEFWSASTERDAASFYPKKLCQRTFLPDR